MLSLNAGKTSQGGKLNLQTERGRPSKYKKVYCEKLIKHMSKGLSFETFGPSIGVAKSTTYLWVEEFKDFSDAKELGTDMGRLFWESIGIGGVTGKMKNFSSSAWIFNMKNRYLWRDNPAEKEEGDGSITIKMNYDKSK